MPQYKAHLFICVNQKENGVCCAEQGMPNLHASLKARFRKPEYNNLVRINKSGCLDKCEEGGVAVLYPSGRWFTHLTPGSADELISVVEKAIETSKN